MSTARNTIIIFCYAAPTVRACNFLNYATSPKITKTTLQGCHRLLQIKLKHGNPDSFVDIFAPKSNKADLGGIRGYFLKNILFQSGEAFHS